MEVLRVENGCPGCGGVLSGTNALGFLCRECRVFWSQPVRRRVTREEVRKVFGEYYGKGVFVTAPNSDKYHVPSCKYAKRIHDPVWLSRRDVVGMKSCACVRVARSA